MHPADTSKLSRLSARWIRLALSLIFTLALPLSVAISAAPVDAAGQANLSVVAIQAHLLLSKTGQLSSDVLAADSVVALNNVIAGDNASTATLVKVKLALADPKRLPQQATLRLVATERGKRGARVLLDQSSRVGPFSGDGVSYVGFWLPNTGCAAIALQATVSGAKQAPGSKLNLAASAEILFTCNE